MICIGLPDHCQRVAMVVMVAMVVTRAFLHYDADNPLFSAANCVSRCWDE